MSNLIAGNLIGINEFAGTSETIANLATKDGYINIPLSALSFNLRGIFDGDIKYFTDGSSLNFGKLIKAGKVNLMPDFYNEDDAPVTFETKYPILDLIDNCDYIYLYSSEYVIEFGAVSKAINIDVTKAEVLSEDDNGFEKQLYIEYNINKNYTG